MKALVIRHCVAFVLAIGTGAMLMHTSHDVRVKEDELKRLEHSVERERETIRVLQAEWAYLNRPGRLEMLASQYLDLVPPGTSSLPRDLVSALPNEALEDSVVKADGLSRDISFTVGGAE